MITEVYVQLFMIFYHGFTVCVYVVNSCCSFTCWSFIDMLKLVVYAKPFNFTVCKVHSSYLDVFGSFGFPIVLRQY